MDRLLSLINFALLDVHFLNVGIERLVCSLILYGVYTLTWKIQKS